MDTSHIEPLVVRPAEACRRLSCATTKLYALIAAGELDSFTDGARYITTESIYRYLAKKLAEKDKPRVRSTPVSVAARKARRAQVEA